MTTQDEPGLAEGLKTCRACGITISSYVNKCPGCGHHTHLRSHAQHARAQNRWQAALAMLAAVIVFVVILVVVIVSGS